MGPPSDVCGFINHEVTPINYSYIYHKATEIRQLSYLGGMIVYPIVPNGFADHYPVFKWLFHWEYTLFSDKPIFKKTLVSLLTMHYLPDVYQWKNVSSEGDENEDLQSILESSNVKVDILWHCRAASRKYGGSLRELGSCMWTRPTLSSLGTVWVKKRYPLVI